MKNTPKMAKFAGLWRELRNAREAYRQSYDVRPGTKPETVWDSTCELLQDPWLARRIVELEIKARELHLVTIKSLTAELEKARGQAGKLGAVDVHLSSISVAAREIKAVKL